MSTTPRQEMLQELKTIEARLAQEKPTIDLRFRRAQLLMLLEENEKATVGYLEILKEAPTHYASLVNCATLLEKYNTTHARSIYEAVIQCHPDKTMPRVNFGNLLRYAGELDAAREQYEAALSLEPENIKAHQGLCLIFRETGDDAKMAYHKLRGHYYYSPQITHVPFLGDTEPIQLLLLTASIENGNLHWRNLVNHNIFQLTLVNAEFYNPAIPFPEHDLVLNAIGDPDICRTDLEAAQILIQQTTAPVINLPAAVLNTGRFEIAERLRHLPNVQTPRMTILTRESLIDAEAAGAQLAAHGLTYPFLLRSLGFQTGRYFTMVETPEALEAAAQSLPGKSILAIEYLDARGADGYFRKYRVMMIDGVLYPLHLAIASQWKIHYFTAQMMDNALYQAEEAQFLKDMHAVLGEKAITALQAVQSTLGLDYGGIDFGLSPTGEVLIFEANAMMNIIVPNKNPQWDYRRPAIDAASEAFQQLLHSRCHVPC